MFGIKRVVVGFVATAIVAGGSITGTAWYVNNQNANHRIDDAAVNYCLTAVPTTGTATQVWKCMSDTTINAYYVVAR